MGDLTLYGQDKGGSTFFERLKAQLDLVLAQTFPVHFYFFAEEPETRSAQADYGATTTKKKKVGGWVGKGRKNKNTPFPCVCM